MYAAVDLTVFINRQSGSRSLSPPPTLLVTIATKLMAVANSLRCQPQGTLSIPPWGLGRFPLLSAVTKALCLRFFMGRN